MKIEVHGGSSLDLRATLGGFLGRLVGVKPAHRGCVVVGSIPTGRPTSMRGLDLALRGVVLIVGLSCAGCVREVGVPTQPTSTATVTVTVRALRYQTDTPVPGAVVTVDGRESGTTQADGAVVVRVPMGRETAIGCSKPGWESLMPWAAATIYADGEKWTFYLRPALDP